MPNWCEGVLKARGKKKDLFKFLNYGIERLNYKKGPDFSLEEIPLGLKVDEEFGEYELTEESIGWLHIKDTRRCFLDSLHWWLPDDEEEVVIRCIDIKQAWRLEVEQFANISRKYHIDFKIKGYESGGQFSQEFEILDGNITKYEEKQYENWWWDVDDPRLGG